MTLIALALLSAVQPATLPEADSGEIVVNGVRESTLDLKRLRAADAAYRAGRAQFAPESRFVFELRPKDGLKLEGTTLTLRSGATQLPVALDARGRFSLPDLPAGKWELVHNRGKGRIAVRPLVFSPGATEEDRPLGDLRLQCRAAWEIIKGEVSFVARSLFATAGGCSSSRIQFMFGTLRPIESATVTTAGRTTPLKLHPDHKRFAAPLADKNLPNSARIHITHS